MTIGSSTNPTNRISAGPSRMVSSTLLRSLLARQALPRRVGRGPAAAGGTAAAGPRSRRQPPCVNSSHAGPFTEVMMEFAVLSDGFAK